MPTDEKEILAIINELLRVTVEQKASDLHLVVGKPPLLRIDGVLQPLGDRVLGREDCEKLCFAFCTADEKDKFIKQREIDLAYEDPDHRRFRINLFWERTYPSAVLRAIPTTVPSMEELLLGEKVKEMTEYPHGLVLVTGPTGSGKSTTLASMIEHVNHTSPDNIITLEDPIEFLFTPDKATIRQRQFGHDFIAFNEGLKHVLRQDPDIVMVGEMRDPETIATTLTIAETGHLVLATLHTQNAPQTIDRIIDAMPPHQQNQVRAQLALTLRAIISQQLLPKVGGGRIAAREILINTPAISNLIRQNQIGQVVSIMQTASEEGMHTLAQDLGRLMKEGLIEREVALSYLTNPDYLPMTAREAPVNTRGGQ